MKLPPSTKICLVSSSGGHLLKAYMLEKWWRKYSHFWVTSNNAFSQSLLNKEKIYVGYFPENRNIINTIKNLILAFRLLIQEKPTLIFSTGAGIAPPFFLAAKILGIKTIFMETFILIPQATLSGKLIYYLSDYFFVQNKKLLKVYPSASYVGSIFKI